MTHTTPPGRDERPGLFGGPITPDPKNVSVREPQVLVGIDPAHKTVCLVVHGLPGDSFTLHFTPEQAVEVAEAFTRKARILES